MENLKHANYRSEKNETKNPIFKRKGRILELEKYFIKRQRTKAKRERKKIFFKPIIVPIDDMDRFEEKEIKKKRHIKNTWYD